MPDYHRIYIQGGVYFFTVVTYKRYPIFKEESSVVLLKNCINNVIAIHPFKVCAMVILPDHIHTIWKLPLDDSNFSLRWSLIKRKFSRNYAGKRAIETSESMINKGERGIWQRRFWEHVIRDEADFSLHCDYIHYNPVRHGFVKSPGEWKNSSFRSFVDKGYYPQNWGDSVNKDIARMNLE